METFEYDALLDPITQIRLLHIHAGDKADPISISIDTYERGEAPQYAALSYMWGGSELTKRISVDGRILDVTENCWYALGQLRLSRLYTHFWIDAICIDQHDLEEKGLQVNLMGETFRQAECCVVSMGRHTKDSTFIYRHIIGGKFSAGHGKEDNLELQVRRWSAEADTQAVQRLSSALLGFGEHHYWRRLWIVQEFSLPRKVLMLCGSQCLPLEDIVSLYKAYNLFGGLGPAPELPITTTLAIRKDIQESRGGISALSQILLSLGHRECLDSRDSVFGLLSLVDWSYTSSKISLDADYTIPLHRLAINVLKHCQDDGIHQSFYHETRIARQLINMLKIGPDDPHMVAAAHSRAMSEEGHTTVGQAVKTVHVKHVEYNRYQIVSLSDPRHTATDDTPTEAALRTPSSAWISLTVSSHVELDASMVIVDNESVLEEPDLPVPSFTVSGPYRNVLVLKALGASTSRYQIVCHGFIESSNQTYSSPWFPNSWPFFEIDMKDLFFWVWKLHYLPADQRRDGLLNFQFCWRKYMSYAIVQLNKTPPDSAGVEEIPR